MSLFQLKNLSIRPIWVLVIFCTVFFNAGTSQTKPIQSKQTLENKKKKLNDEINQINSLLNETKVGKKTSLNQLVAINTKISIREELIGAIVAEIHQLNREIKQNEKARVFGPTLDRTFS